MVLNLPKLLVIELKKCCYLKLDIMIILRHYDLEIGSKQLPPKTLKYA